MLHIRELKRVAHEDRSKFARRPTLSGRYARPLLWTGWGGEGGALGKSCTPDAATALRVLRSAMLLGFGLASGRVGIQGKLVGRLALGQQVLAVRQKSEFSCGPMCPL